MGISDSDNLVCMELPEHLLVVYQVLDSAVYRQAGVKELHQDAAPGPFRYGAVDELDERADVGQSQPVNVACEIQCTVQSGFVPVRPVCDGFGEDEPRGGDGSPISCLLLAL